MISEDAQDLIRRAERIYEQNLRAELEKAHLHEFVAIEPDSGDYFLGPTMSKAVQAARAAHPDRRPYVMRVGHDVALHIGSGS